MDNIFSKIVQKKISVTAVYEDERVLAFRDIRPVAPVHILIIPKKEITSLAAVTEEDKELLGHILFVAHQLAESEGIAKTGYRVVTNSGPDSQREVEYLHFHLIGGKALGSKIG